MIFWALVLAYLTVGLIWHLRNKRNHPLYRIMAPPALIIASWPFALFFKLKKLRDPRRFRVGFFAYDPEHPYGGIPEYNYFASHEDAVAFAKDKARKANRKVCISDEAVLWGDSPKEFTISPDK
jgi:hypothetical protein